MLPRDELQSSSPGFALIVFDAPEVDSGFLDLRLRPSPMPRIFARTMREPEPPAEGHQLAEYRRIRAAPRRHEQASRRHRHSAPPVQAPPRPRSPPWIRRDLSSVRPRAAPARAFAPAPRDRGGSAPSEDLRAHTASAVGQPSAQSSHSTRLCRSFAMKKFRSPQTSPRRESAQPVMPGWR